MTQKNTEWFNDENFWDVYAPVMFDESRWAEVPIVSDGVISLAKFDLYNLEKKGRKTPRILDLCCGFGRISLELARRGCRVTGVDITKSYLEAGRDDAARENLDVEFVERDVRVFKRRESFDLAVNLYNSFGYFENPADDLLLAKNAFASVKPGGAFIIEVLGKEIAVRDYTEAEWFERAGWTVLTETSPVDSWGSIWNRWILLKEGKKGLERHEKVFIQRLYAASELKRLLLEAGFERVEIYGDWDGRVYDMDAIMLITVARKAAQKAG
jgi:SAM-dependent methyltransferase